MNPSLTMWRNARRRAREAGLPFNLLVTDVIIPDRCPVFGTPLVAAAGRAADDSPSLDRTTPHLGYVRGNVHVISWRANRAKNNLTLDELEAITTWLGRHVAPAPRRARKRKPT